jgi:uncharacterized protein (TIGR02391 family)
MNKFLYQLGICDKVIDSICKMIESGVSSDQIHHKELYDELNNLLPLIPEEFSIYTDRLERVLLPNLKVSDIIQTNQYGHQSRVHRTGINPYVLGQVIATRCYIRKSLEKSELSISWQSIHCDISKHSRELFENGHYAESVESAVLLLMVRVKNIIKDSTGVLIDGTAAMQKAFSAKDPIIKVADIDTNTGADIQQGIMDISVGVVRSIRNPKVHEIISYSKREAMQKLHLISFLMDTIDKAELIRKGN